MHPNLQLPRQRRPFLLPHPLLRLLVFKRTPARPRIAEPPLRRVQLHLASDRLLELAQLVVKASKHRALF